MEKQIKDTIEKLIHFPYDYRTRENVSPIALLNESGYVENSNLISEVEIEEILNLYPDSINEWLLWSENKRTAKGWLFTRDEDDGWCFVGYFPESKEFEEINTKDVFKACAAFVKREAEYLRN